MYRDTEQTYGGWTLDVFEADGQWVCDYWSQDGTSQMGTARAKKKADAVAEAKRRIDAFKLPTNPLEG